jgi:hypothetical protein
MQQPNDQQEGQKQGVPPQGGDNQPPTDYEHPCRGVVPPGGLAEEE